ncbi:Hypothetical predicted protein [Pelobates cultripes]|uniref:Uncharacterized protein n=1 Tax=Pelobates cultripes TaxID=61616 RepID=A0AAD1WFF8_PELCU|nr:Hypothetical predicted protein [Pelobates cultripes]
MTFHALTTMDDSNSIARSGNVGDSRRPSLYENVPAAQHLCVQRVKDFVPKREFSADCLSAFGTSLQKILPPTLTGNPLQKDFPLPDSFSQPSLVNKSLLAKSDLCYGSCLKDIVEGFLPGHSGWAQIGRFGGVNFTSGKLGTWSVTGTNNIWFSWWWLVWFENLEHLELEMTKDVRTPLEQDGFWQLAYWFLTIPSFAILFDHVKTFISGLGQLTVMLYVVYKTLSTTMGKVRASYQNIEQDCCLH